MHKDLRLRASGKKFPPLLLNSGNAAFANSLGKLCTSSISDGMLDDFGTGTWVAPFYLMRRAGRPRFCAEILGLATAGACSFALFFALLGATAGVFTEPEPARAAAANQPAFEGMIECSHCGAKHSPRLARNAADCVRVCAHMGYSFVLVNGDQAYRLIGDTNVLKKLATRRVRVVGELQGNTLHASSITPAD